MSDRSVQRQLGITGVVLLLVALVLSVLAITAVAEEPEEEHCTSIAFMDAGKLTVDLDWLVESGGALTVRVHNCSAEVQTVTLSLEGFVPASTEPKAALLKAVSPTHEPEALDPGETDDLTLAFVTETLKAFTETATHTGSLVATSHPGGDLIRREFELKVEVEEEAVPRTLGLSDLPKALDTVTFQGTNYLPSIVNPLGPALFWLVAAVVLSSIVWCVLQLSVAGKTATGLARILIGLAVLILLAVGLPVGVVVRQGGLGPQLGLVAVEPISAPALGETVKSETSDADAADQAGEGDATEQVTGQSTAPPESTPALVPLVVVAAGDRVGVMGERGGRWEVAGLTRAGAYSSKIDLTPADDDKTTTAFTVNVADWWPFAFFTIALGVVVGYKLTQYYNKGRTAGRIRTDTAALWKQIAAEESHWQAKHAGRPYAGYSMVQAAKAQIVAIEGLLRDGKELGDDGAEGQLKALKTLVDQFAAFRASTVELHEKHAKLRCLYDEESFGLTWEDVEAAEHCSVLLKGKALVTLAQFEGGPAFSDRDTPALSTHSNTPSGFEGGPAFSDRDTEVTEAIGWVEAVNAVLTDVRRWIDFANGLSPGTKSWPPEIVKKLGPDRLRAIVEKLEVGTEKATLQTEKDKLKLAGRSALTARKKEDVVEQHDAARKVYVNLQALKDAALMAALDKALKTGNKGIKELSEFLAVPALARVRNTREAVDTMTDLAEVKVPRPTVCVDCEVWTLEDKGDKDCQGDPDDLFQFTATLTFGPSLAKDYHVQWDFGDDTYSPTISIPKNSSPTPKLKTRHQYTKGGTYTIRLLDVKDDATVPIEEDKEAKVTVNDLPGRSARRLRSFRLTDTQMTVVSGALAVATGTLALYGPTWGSPKDYFQAFLWGAVVSESAKAGAKIVKGLVDHNWPLSE